MTTGVDSLGIMGAVSEDDTTGFDKGLTGSAFGGFCGLPTFKEIPRGVGSLGIMGAVSEDDTTGFDNGLTGSAFGGFCGLPTFKEIPRGVGSLGIMGAASEDDTTGFDNGLTGSAFGGFCGLPTFKEIPRGLAGPVGRGLSTGVGFFCPRRMVRLFFCAASGVEEVSFSTFWAEVGSFSVAMVIPDREEF
ncbi:MAG: hypothetical protein HQL84_18045 [Magnetococcales bacterium]|nr:hypothetical protein [Magnetococcales bacterium]MBF0151922.1 hypothetical protein [Magnetococcales bacterium]MBF0174823.1 hypothetical protein [Magnetococcales bacterium]MBF0632846.1 hypothetical protein [Magnetococcales bacterium]